MDKSLRMALFETSLSTTIWSLLMTSERELTCVGATLSTPPVVIESCKQTPSVDILHVYYVALKSTALCPSETSL